MSMKKNIMIGIAILTTIAVLYFPYSDSNLIAQQSGPVLNDNWFNALNWIKNNTPECSIIATYWDPGHFITGIAERPVVFDGATQNNQRTLNITGHLSLEEIEKIAAIPNFNYTYYEENGIQMTSITTARIQDIGMSLMTSNESQAIQILRKYQSYTQGIVLPTGTTCKNFSIYYLATSDLLGKSQWWTYFGSWLPSTHTGTKYFYIATQLGTKKPILSDNSIAYVYPLSRTEEFVVHQSNSSMSAYYQQGNNLLKVEKMFFFSGQYGYMISVPDAELKGMLWLSPDMGTAIFVPPEIEESMFTKMFLFNGQGMNKYTLIQNFGGEVKLFEVNMSI